MAQFSSPSQFIQVCRSDRQAGLAIHPEKRKSYGIKALWAGMADYERTHGRDWQAVHLARQIARAARAAERRRAGYARDRRGAKLSFRERAGPD